MLINKTLISKWFRIFRHPVAHHFLLIAPSSLSIVFRVGSPAISPNWRDRQPGHGPSDEKWTLTQHWYLDIMLRDVSSPVRVKYYIQKTSAMHQHPLQKNAANPAADCCWEGALCPTISPWQWTLEKDSCFAQFFAPDSIGVLVMVLIHTYTLNT